MYQLAHEDLTCEQRASCGDPKGWGGVGGWGWGQGLALPPDPEKPQKYTQVKKWVGIPVGSHWDPNRDPGGIYRDKNSGSRLGSRRDPSGIPPKSRRDLVGFDRDIVGIPSGFTGIPSGFTGIPSGFTGIPAG